MSNGIRTFLNVLVVVLIALVLAPLIITGAVTAATASGIGSFTGVAALLGLIPLGFVILIVWYIYRQMKD